MMYKILTLLSTPALAAGDYGLSDTAGAAELIQFGDNLPNLIGTILGTALSLVGVLFFALMLYGGITWMLAHGNAENEKKALSTITAAIIGILIVLGSYALTSFVLGSVKSAGGGPTKVVEPAVEKKCVVKTDESIAEFCLEQPINSCPCTLVDNDGNLVNDLCQAPIIQSHCPEKDGTECAASTICEWK